MSDVTVSLERLRERTDSHVTLSDGTSGAFASLDQHLNTNAVAIGVGLESMQFDQDQFPVVVYWPEDDGPAALAFENGLVACLDADTSEEASDCVAVTLDQLADLGLLTGETRDAVTIESVERLDRVDVSVPGHVVLSSCPECGERLSGDENYCPECGVELPDPGTLV